MSKVLKYHYTRLIIVRPQWATSIVTAFTRRTLKLGVLSREQQTPFLSYVESCFIHFGAWLQYLQINPVYDVNKIYSSLTWFALKQVTCVFPCFPGKAISDEMYRLWRILICEHLLWGRLSKIRGMQFTSMGIIIIRIICSHDHRIFLWVSLYLSMWPLYWNGAQVTREITLTHYERWMRICYSGCARWWFD